MKRLRRPNPSRGERNRTIGLLGTSSGVGVTHCGISLANFLGTKLGYHTAIVEWNNHNHFTSIREAIRGTGISTPFTLYQVDYFMEANETDLVSIYNQEYDYIVLDCGEYRGNFPKEFLISDIKVVIGSLCEWKRQDAIQVITSGNEQTGACRWRYMVSLGQGYDIKLFYKEYGVRLQAIPYIPDPYILTKAATEVWRNLIQF
ncbi:MAG TPA: hypothetical protein VHP81_10565 [Lachnospiraceae bacterium]|nr:hypothetical protein [Lachnospiraceae bacterium]